MQNQRRRSEFSEILESRSYLTGVLGPVTDYPGVTNPTAVVLGDFLNNGRADAAVAGVNPNTGLPTVAIYLSNGDGTYAAPTYNDLAATHGALDLTTTSLSQSPNTDIAVADPVDAKVFMLIGNGDGNIRGSDRHAIWNAAARGFQIPWRTSRRRILISMASRISS